MMGNSFIALFSPLASKSSMHFHNLRRPVQGKSRAGGGLATAFDLAAFRLSMIAPVKKSVNHPRTVATMRVNTFVFAAIPKCEMNSLLNWPCWSLLSLL